MKATNLVSQTPFRKSCYYHEENELLKECVVVIADIIKVMEDGDLETIGRESYEGRLGPSMTAHPKLDPVTGTHLS